MHGESNDIMVPIKDIIEQSMNQNGARYLEDEFNLLRKYFIAALNLRFILPNDLNSVVERFTKKIKFIVLNYNEINNLDYYKISDGVIYINGRLKMSPDVYDITFYKAISEVILTNDNRYTAFNNAMCQMIAEKVHNMTENNMPIIMPSLKAENINGVTHSLRSGYNNYALIITLVKQMFLLKRQNEVVLIRNLFSDGFALCDKIFGDSNSKLLLEILDVIFVLYVNFHTRNETNKSLNLLIEKYQLMVNGLFTEVNPSYYAFLVLLTTDKLKKMCAKDNN